MIRYTCPHCGAQDSTRCEMLPAQDPARPYTEHQMEQARVVGCRVVVFCDLTAHVAEVLAGGSERKEGQA